MINSDLLIILDDGLASPNRAVNQGDEIIWQVDARINSPQCNVVEEFIEDL